MREAPLYLKIGKKDSPLCLFIHGLGMNLNIWLRPEESRIMGGSYPLGILLSRPPAKKGNPKETGKFTFGVPPSNLRSSLHDLEAEGFTVLAYSQKRPAASIDVLLKELEGILKEHSELTKRGVVFITHSRGGILARLSIEHLRVKASGLVSIATPHRGTAMADMAGIMAPLTRVLSPFFAGAEENTVRGAIKRVMDFLSSPAIKELSPESHLIKKLAGQRLKGLKGISFGGTDPTLLTLYRWHKNCYKYEKVFSVPEILTAYLPDRLIPDELRKGRGDSLVTAKSAEMPGAELHRNYRENHAGLIFNRYLRKAILCFVRELR